MQRFAKLQDAKNTFIEYGVKNVSVYSSKETHIYYFDIKHGTKSILTDLTRQKQAGKIVSYC